MDEMELGGLTSLRGVEQRDLASAQLQEGKGKKINNALAQKDCQWWLPHPKGVWFAISFSVNAWFREAALLG